MLLSQLTTCAVGGPAAEYAAASTAQDLIAQIRRADENGIALLLIGGGSNLVVSDEGFNGLVLGIANCGIEVQPLGDSRARLVVQAGEDWDAVVDFSLRNSLSGLEALSGIPGKAGATPVQNVGAYGADVSQMIESVQVYDRVEQRVVELSNEQLQFAYRDSLIKRTSTDGSPRYVVLRVNFLLERGGDSAPIRYAELARQLGVEAGARAEATAVRDCVLGLRRSKGMVYDPADPDSHSTGSFFTNPIVDAELLETLPVDAPRFPVGTDGQVKLSAAWLIDRAGFGKGYGLDGTAGYIIAAGRASLSSKHTLAITNRGGATSTDILALARTVREGVHHAFGVELHNEPLLIGQEL